MPNVALNPAEQAAQEAQDRIHQCIDNGRSFRVEAGAGAGKTYSLIEALRYVIAVRGADLQRDFQQVACITYTNVAKDEIETRTDRHPAVLSSTIHSFCWSLIKDFQPRLRTEVATLPSWEARLHDVDGVGCRAIVYDLGHPKVEDDALLLHHDDVLALTVRLLSCAKFRMILKSRFPILFIDEYQDADHAFADALKIECLDRGDGPLIGLFGDHWQKIYGTGAGLIEHPHLEVIPKHANFRSVPVIVDALNRMRPELTQEVTDPDAEGTVAVYHTNNWIGDRRQGQHWAGDLPATEAKQYLDSLVERLRREGWEDSAKKTKILMLTHNALAGTQGYAQLANVFPFNDAFLKKEDHHIEFLLDTLEPVRIAYEGRRFGEMFAALRTKVPAIRSYSDKHAWAGSMNRLVELCADGTIGEVIDHLRLTERPRVPDAVGRKEQAREQTEQDSDQDDSEALERLTRLREVPYQQVEALKQFIEEQTPFSTKHGVKGAEFDNVLVVFGRGWNQYNFAEFLNWAGPDGNIPSGRRDRYERNRNLFYVTCSRAKINLALLFTQELDHGALATLTAWFGADAVHALSV